MPSRAHFAVRCSGTGSVKVRLNRISVGQSIARPSGRTPFPARRRAASTAAAASTRTFFGSQPRSAHVPPNGRLSIIATVQPAFRHLDATAWAAEPEPITTRSKVSIIGTIAERGLLQTLLVAQSDTRHSARGRHRRSRSIGDEMLGSDGTWRDAHRWSTLFLRGTRAVPYV